MVGPLMNFYSITFDFCLITNKCLLNLLNIISITALHECLLNMIERVLFVIFVVFISFDACKGKGKHVFAGENIQQNTFDFLQKIM